MQQARFVRFSLSYLKSQLFSLHDFPQIRGKWGCRGQSTGKVLETVKERRQEGEEETKESMHIPLNIPLSTHYLTAYPLESHLGLEPIPAHVEREEG